MNPFELKPAKLESLLMDWQEMSPIPYDSKTVDPYTKTRIILMNGTEFEAVWFSHQFTRHCADNDLRRTLALMRRQEQQQQKLIGALKPLDEDILVHTISYEQLAIDLTAALAKREENPYVKEALDFALLEDFDHLYRYADLMSFDSHMHAEDLVGRYTEIMPGRPTIAHHRHPYDSVKYPVLYESASPVTKLCSSIITAAEQQTMNYYMNVAPFYPKEYGRRLYREIGMVEEQHVTHYGSLIDPNPTWLECLLNHQYAECYLYWSAMETESDNYIREIWSRLFDMEVAHLHAAAELLLAYEGRAWQQVMPDGTFPAPLKLESNIDYVRDVLKHTVNLTADRESWTPVDALADDADFFRYQAQVNMNDETVQSHDIVERLIEREGRDYRFETAENPVKALRDRKHDNTAVGRESAVLASQR
ncbi:MAG: hypothetical protein IJ646_02175 [Clostridia bacterium]|nr:hypothetical protein [Clostridia bacterium]